MRCTNREAMPFMANSGSSWPGIAVRRTASLPLAYVPAIHVFASRKRKQGVDARDKRGHDSEDMISHQDTPPPSRDAVRPSFVILRCPSQIEGAGKAGRPMHPRPRVRIEKHASQVHHRFTGITSGFPCAMVLTVSFVVSPETGLCCLRHPCRLCDLSGWLRIAKTSPRFTPS